MNVIITGVSILCIIISVVVVYTSLILGKISDDLEVSEKEFRDSAVV